MGVVKSMCSLALVALKYSNNNRAAPPPRGAHHRRPRSIRSHQRRYSRPAVSIGGLSATLRLQGGSRKRHGEGCWLYPGMGFMWEQAGVGRPNSEGWCQGQAGTFTWDYVIDEVGGGAGV